MTDVTRCLTEGCGREGELKRGVCSRCYALAVQAVKKGKITWTELEAAGVVLAPRTHHGGNMITAPMSRKIDELLERKKRI